MTADAENDQFNAFATLRAVQNKAPGVSDRILKIIWMMRHPEWCDEYCKLTNPDANGDLPCVAFRGADSIEASESAYLNDGNLPFEDHSGGGFYLTTFAAACGEDDGIVEDALGAFEKKSNAAKSTFTKDNDKIFIEAAREGLEAARKRVASFPYAGTVGGEGRVHTTRYREKVGSDQLFGRFARELVNVAIAELDFESMSEDEIVAAVKKKLAVHNRVFMSERLFIALAMEGGDAYHGDGWITAIARDVEGMAAGLTGGMIETGGLNVAHIGSQAKRVLGRTEAYTDSHFAFSFMRDIAFAKAAGGDTAAFEKAYKLVKKLLAKVVFAREERMRKRLAETSVLLEENGLDVLAKADAEAFRERRECPTYDTIDAGTFARALAAVDGRKGGASTAKGRKVDADKEKQWRNAVADGSAAAGVPVAGRVVDADKEKEWRRKHKAGLSQTSQRAVTAHLKGKFPYRLTMSHPETETQCFFDIAAKRGDANAFVFGVYAGTLDGLLYKKLSLDPGDKRDKVTRLFLPTSSAVVDPRQSPVVRSDVRTTFTDFQYERFTELKKKGFSWCVNRVLVTPQMIEDANRTTQTPSRKAMRRAPSPGSSGKSPAGCL